MVARLRAKSGAEQIGVTIGDFATTTVAGRFSVAYLVFNTIMNLTTQDEQILCFRNVAAHLQPGGSFVIEVAVPDLQRLPPGETVRAFTVSPTRLGFDEYDIAAQGLISHHYWIGDEQARDVLDAVSLRVAGRTGLDGSARRDVTAGTLGRLETRALHQREYDPCFCLAETGSTFWIAGERPMAMRATEVRLD